MPPKWPTCARRFLSQCPLPPPPPGCVLDQCLAVEPPGFESVGSGKRQGGRRREGGGWEKGGPSGLPRRGGGALPSRVPLLLCTGKPTSQAWKQLSFTLAGLNSSHLIGTLGRGTDLLAFSPSHFLFLLSSLSLFLPLPPSLNRGVSAESSVSQGT